MDNLLEYAASGGRLTAGEILELLTGADLTELGIAAGLVCDRLHPEPVRTYVIDRNINYTNICTSGCSFCAFYRPPGHPEGYVLTTDEVLAKVQEAVDLGATQILMQGGLHPELKIEWYESLLSAIKSSFDVQIHSLSAPEIVHIADMSGLDIETTLTRLQRAGLDSLPGGGAEILVDSVRVRVSPGKASTSEWTEVMECAARLGMKATATMLFGHVESLKDRVEHLIRIRDMQDRLNVFTAFIPWTYQPSNTALGGTTPGGHDYLKMLAVSRLALDNIPNIQASWVTQGDAIAQVALRFGANDIGSTMIEENVVAAAGVKFRLSEKRIIELIHGAGYDAAQRDTLYKTLRVHSRMESVK
ncbi:MAG TPA: cyclic dehypoxanthinyl futalosine synthase [Armatimonadota bacterium]|nr:cyclic dehypoxanthinyl futalosine synthase [Armatimonadota bacterium]